VMVLKTEEIPFLGLMKIHTRWQNVTFSCVFLQMCSVGY
jgi:hypothetical protein